MLLQCSKLYQSLLDPVVLPPVFTRSRSLAAGSERRLLDALDSAHDWGPFA